MSVGGSAAAARSSASLANARSSLLSLAEPPPHQVDARTLEYFSIELITAVVASTSTAVARQEERRRRFELDNAAPGSSSAPVASTSKPAPVDGADPNDPPENELRQRIDLIGFRIGWGLAERLSRDRPPMAKQAVPEGSTSATAPPPETLEVIKFICKDVWSALYGKQIDNLRTNHRGTWVLQDAQHRPLIRLSGIGDDPAARRQALRLLYMPCGIVRGAAACLGLPSTVQPELGVGGQCTFQVKTAK